MNKNGPGQKRLDLKGYFEHYSAAEDLFIRLALSLPCEEEVVCQLHTFPSSHGKESASLMNGSSATE